MNETFPQNSNPEDLPEEKGLSEAVPEQSVEEVLAEKRLLIQGLVDSLGFVESAAMSAVRSEVSGPEGMSAERLIEWRGMAEASIEIIADQEAFVRAQIGILMSKALMYLDAGKRDEFYDDIDDAISYAKGAGLEDVLDILYKL